MKPLTGLWPEIVAFENLYRAWRRARAGKAHKAAVLGFEMDLEGQLCDLRAALCDGRYRPGEYRLFTIYERKPRLIAAAPFVDRVVHHALMNVIEPPLDRRFIHDCWACRVGKGVHRALHRYQRWARRHAYVLKMDIQAYFPSIDHTHLKAQLRARIADEPTLALLDRIIDSATPVLSARRPVFPGDDLLTPLERPAGLPIGNLTSQFFANLYLDDFDHWLSAACGGPYLRYVDDMVVLGDDKGALWALVEQVRAQLAVLRLRLHPHKVQVTPVARGIDLLGYHLWPYRRRLRNDNGHRFARRLRGLAEAYARGEVDFATINPGVQSWLGHARHGETEGLRRAILGPVVFRRTAANTQSLNRHKERSRP